MTVQANRQCDFSQQSRADRRITGGILERARALPPESRRTGDGLAERAGMNALDLLKEDHDVLKKYLEMAEEDGHHDKRDLISRIGTHFREHEAIEERVFYPALKEHPKAKDIVLEGYQEHHVVDILLNELEQLATSDERWPAKLKVLKENVEHHIEEEEGEMFKKARSVFDKDELEALGTRMESMKAGRPA
ncbi:MAG: hemerythrin domain-containing protein [Acidobacteriota bacterium]